MWLIETNSAFIVCIFYAAGAGSFLPVPNTLPPVCDGVADSALRSTGTKVIVTDWGARPSVTAT